MSTGIVVTSSVKGRTSSGDSSIATAITVKFSPSSSSCSACQPGRSYRHPHHDENAWSSRLRPPHSDRECSSHLHHVELLTDEQRLGMVHRYAGVVAAEAFGLQRPAECERQHVGVDQ